MRYMGGKYRQSRGIVECIRPYAESGFTYVEPFCGGLSSAAAVARDLHPGRIILGDVYGPLVKLWSECLSHGTDWLPESCDEETHRKYRDNRPDDPLTAYYLFGFSYGGDINGGFIKPEYAGHPRNGISRKIRWIKTCKSVDIECCSYEELTIDNGSVVYCDPPYEDRKVHHGFREFDYGKFWQWVRDLSSRCVVFTSCFNAPDDFRVVYQWGDTVVRPHNLSSEKSHVSGYEKLVVYGAD